MVGVVALMGACGEDGDDAASTTTEGETTTTEDDQDAAKAEILAAHAGAWEDFVRAGNPPDPDAPFLSDNQTGEVLDGTRDVLRRYAAEGVGVQGEYITAGEITLLRERSATLEDCGVDQLELVRLDTGEVVGSSNGVRDGLVVTLVLEDGAWKVSQYERNEEVCS